MNKKNIGIMIVTLGVLFVSSFFGVESALAQTSVNSCNSATLNASISTNGFQTEAWFEWGTSQSLGNTTSHQIFNSDSSMSQPITGLISNTTYFYRAVAQNSQGTAQGSILSFITPVCGGTGSGAGTPTVSTNAPTVFNEFTAMMNGFASGNGQPTDAWFEWGTSQSFGNQTPRFFIGTGSLSFSHTLNNLNQNTTYYYRAVAQAGTSGQIVFGNTQTFTTFSGNCQFGNCNNNNNNNQQPYVTTFSPNSIGNTFAVFNGNVTTNGTIVTRWFEWGTSQGFLPNQTVKSQQSFDGTFSQTVNGLQPNTTYYYRAVAQSTNGQQSFGNIISFVTTGFGNNNCFNNNNFFDPSCNNNNNQNFQNVTQLQALTLLATNVGASSARLNGIALINQSAQTRGYFEWGFTNSLGNTTDIEDIGSAPSTSFFASLFGLQNGHTYFYRAVAVNAYGTARGDIKTFTTGSNVIITPPSSTTVIVGTTGTAKTSLVALSIDRDGACNYRGQTVEYTVAYKNTSARDLKDVVVRVLVPEELTFSGTSSGSYSAADRNVVITLGNLSPGQGGTVRVSANVDRNALLGKSMVVTAYLVDTVTTTGAQEEVVAYSINNICEGAVSQSAASIFGGNFIPTTLVGWLILFLVALGLVAVARSIYGSRAV